MSQFSDFIRNTKGKEREEVMLEVAEEAIKDQEEIITTTNKQENTEGWGEKTLSFLL